MLYVSDLDGTLLNEKGELSSETHRELELLLNQGLQFTLATARNLSSIRRIFSKLKLELPVIQQNGALITDLKTGFHHFTHGLSASIMQELLFFLKLHKISAFVSTFDGQQDHRLFGSFNEAQSSSDAHAQAYPCVPVKDWSEVLQQQVISLTLVEKKDRALFLMEEIQSRFKEDLQLQYCENPEQAGWMWVGIYAQHATKGHALVSLAELLRVDPEEVTVFGNGLNDIDLFTTAGRAIAVGNAHAEVKSRATQVIGPHDKNSVIQFIKADFYPEPIQGYKHSA